MAVVELYKEDRGRPARQISVSRGGDCGSQGERTCSPDRKESLADSDLDMPPYSYVLYVRPLLRATCVESTRVLG